MNDYFIGTEVYVQGTEWTNACASTFYRGIVVSKRVGGWMDVIFDDDNDTFPFRASKLDEHARKHSLHCTETLLSAAAFLDVATLDVADAILSLSTVYVMPKPGRGKGLMGSAQTFVRAPLKDAKSRPVLKQIN
jgi:hypothetical protein